MNTTKRLVPVGCAELFCFMDIYHDKPVNRQAEMLLRKAPWWAKCPEAVKKAAPILAEKIDVEKLADTTKAPPSDKKDRRGPVNLWRNNGTAFVIGWSHGEARKRVRQPSNRRKPEGWVGEWDQTRRNIGGWCMEYWWAIHKGDVILVKRDGKRNRWYLQNIQDRD